MCGSPARAGACRCGAAYFTAEDRYCSRCGSARAPEETTGGAAGCAAGGSAGAGWRAVREAAARHRATLPCGTSSGAPPDVPGLSEEAGAAAAAPSVPRRA
ncbi:unnamed protein product [Prorocentrum cordatum]|nr:unnamed protein product [Polarella glacialis]